MNEYQILYVRKTANLHEHITALGNDGGFSSVADVIASIRAGNRWYTLEGGRRAEIKINKSPSGREYVQTVADGYWQNNLLSLQSGPALGLAYTALHR